MVKLSLYPGMIDNFTDKRDETGSGDGDFVLAEHVNHLQDAVYAIQTSLGTNPQQGATNLSARLNTIEQSKKLSVPSILFYSGDPSEANGSASVSEAAPYFTGFSHVILDSATPYVPNTGTTEDLIETVHLASGTKFFASMDAGTFTANWTPDAIGVLMEDWPAAGIDGVYFYNFEYVNGVNRERQNDLIAVAHQMGLSVLVKCTDPDQIFSVANTDGYNIDNEPTTLGQNDGVVYFGFGTTIDGYQNIATLHPFMNKLLGYRNAHGNGIFAIGIVNESLDANTRNERYYYCQALAMLYSIDGIHMMVSSQPAKTIEVYPTFPIVGAYYEPDPKVILQGSDLYRFTKTGRISINTTTFRYNFEDIKIPLSFIDLYGDQTTIDASKLSGTMPSTVTINISARLNELNDNSVSARIINFAGYGDKLVTAVNTATEFKISGSVIEPLSAAHIESIVAHALSENLGYLLNSGDLDATLDNLSARWLSAVNAYFNNVMIDNATIDGLNAGVIRSGVIDGKLISLDSITSDNLTIHANGGVNKWIGSIVLKEAVGAIANPSPEMVLGKDVYRRFEYHEGGEENQRISITDKVGTSLQNYLVMWQTWVYATAPFSSNAYLLEADARTSLYVNDTFVQTIGSGNIGYTLSLQDGWNKIQVLQDHNSELSSYFGLGVTLSNFARQNEAGEPHPVARMDAYAEQNTQIIGDFLKTGTIKATHLDVEDIKTGLLEADLIKAMELYVKELIATDGEFEQLISDITISRYLNTTNIRVYSEAQDIDPVTGLLSGNTGSLMIDNGGMLVASKPKAVISVLDETLTIDMGSQYRFLNDDLVAGTENIRIIDHDDLNKHKTLDQRWYELYYVDGEILILSDVLTANGIVNYSIIADYSYRDDVWPIGTNLVKIDRFGIHVAFVQPDGAINWNTKLTGSGLSVNYADIISVKASSIVTSTLNAAADITVGVKNINDKHPITISGSGYIEVATEDQSVILDGYGLKTTNNKFSINSNGTISAIDGNFSGTVYAQSGFIGTGANLIQVDSQGLVLGTGSIVDTRNTLNQKLKIDASGIIAEAGTIGGLEITTVINSLNQEVLGLQAQIDSLGTYSMTPGEINVTGAESVVINKGTLVVKDNDPLDAMLLKTYLTLGKLDATQYGLNVGLTGGAYIQLDQAGLRANNGTINTLNVASDGSITLVGNITANSGSLNNLNITGTINVQAGGSIVTSNVTINDQGIVGPQFSLTNTNKSISGWVIGTTLNSANNSIVLDGAGEQITVSGVTIGKYATASYGIKAGDVILSNTGLIGPSFSLGSTGINATGGTIGGWNIISNTLSSGNLILDSANKTITVNNGLTDQVTLGRYDSTVGAEKYGIKAGGVTLDATGVHATGFELDNAGITATAGQIAGWNINQEKLSSGNIHLDKANGAIWIGSDFATPAVRLSSDGTGKIGIVELNKSILTDTYSIYTENFKVKDDGSVTITGAITATSGVFTGTIQANAGWFGSAINPVLVDDTGLKAGDVNITKAGITVGQAGATSLTINSSGINLNNENSSITIGSLFSASKDGIVTTAGKIANWTIEQYQIRTDSNEIVMNAQNKAITIGTELTLGEYAVGQLGLKAGNTTLNSAGITANQGTIAGWTIDETAISKTTGSVKTSLSDGSLVIADITNPLTPVEKVAFKNDGTGRIGTLEVNRYLNNKTYSLYTANFNIDIDGNVSLSGSITSTSGSIGGWTIADTIKSANDSIILNASLETIAITDKVIIGKYDGANYGILANQGIIGGWTISNNTLTAGSIALRSQTGQEQIAIGTAIVLDADGSGKIGNILLNENVDIAGPMEAPNIVAFNLWTPNFNIDMAGNVNMTGHLASGSGSIGGWTIGGDRLHSTHITLDSNLETITIKDAMLNDQVIIGRYDNTLGLEKYGIKAGNTILNSTGIQAASGKIGGMTIGTNHIRSNDFVSGVKGFSLYLEQPGTEYEKGIIEANSVKITGEVHANVGSFGTSDSRFNASDAGIWVGNAIGGNAAIFWIASQAGIDHEGNTIAPGDAYFKGQITVSHASVIDMVNEGDLVIKNGAIIAGSITGGHVRMSAYSGGTSGGEIYAQDANMNEIFSVSALGARFTGSITATTGAILGDLSVGSAHNVYLDGTRGAIFLYDTTREDATRIVRLNNQGLYISTDSGSTYLPALTSGGLNANAINDGTLVISDSGPGASGITIRQWDELKGAYQDNIVINPSGINVYNGAITVHSETTGEILIGGGYLRVKGLDMGVVTSNNYVGNGSFSMVSEDYGLAQLTQGEIFLGTAQSSGGAVSNPTYHYAGWPDYGTRNPHTVYTYKINPDGTTHYYDVNDINDINYPKVTRVSFNPQWAAQHPTLDFAVVPNDACNFITVIDKEGNLVRHLKAWKGGLFGTAFSPNGQRMITCGDDIDRKRSPWDMCVFDVSSPDPMDWNMIGTISVGEFPSEVVCDNNGFAYCTVSLDDTIYKLDMNTMRVDSVIKLVDFRGMPVIPKAICIANDYSAIYVAGVVTDMLYVIGTGNDFGAPLSTHGLIPVLGYKGIIHGMATMPDGRLAVCSTSEKDGFVGIFNLLTDTYDTYIDYTATDDRLDLPADVTIDQRATWFHTSTTLIAHPTLTLLYVTVTNRCAVSILNYGTGQLIEQQRVPAGSNPSGIVLSRDATRLYVPNHHYHTYPLGSNRIWGYRTSDNYYDTEDVFDTTQKYYHYNPAGMVMHNDKYLWVANRATDKVIVIDTEFWSDETKRTEITGLGQNPYELRMNAAKTKIYVSNDDAIGKYEPDFISILDVATKTLDAEKIYVGDRPIGMAISSDDKYLYVACYGRGVVQKVSLSTKKVVNSVATIGNPKYLHLVGAALYASCPDENKVQKINTASFTIEQTLTTDNQPGQMLSVGNRLYIVNESSGNIIIYNIDDNAYHGRIKVGSKPKPIAYNPVLGLIYVGNAGEGSVCIINAVTNQVIEWCMTGDNAEYIVVNPTGDKWYVSAHGPEDIVAYGEGAPFVGDAYLDSNNITHKYGSSYWIPTRSKWVRGIDNTLTSFSSLEFKPNESLQGKKGYVNMTVMGMFDAFAQIQQDVYPMTNYSDGSCEYTTETIELEEAQARELSEDVANYKDIPGKEKRRIKLFDAENIATTYTEDVDYRIDYAANTIERIGTAIPASRVRSNTAVLTGETPVAMIPAGYTYNTIEVYPLNSTLLTYEEDVDYAIDRVANTIRRIINSRSILLEPKTFVYGFFVLNDAPVKEGSVAIYADTARTILYNAGTDYTIDHQLGKVGITTGSAIDPINPVYVDYIRTTKMPDGEAASIVYRHMMRARYYYHPYKRNFKDAVLSAETFWRWPRPGNQYVTMQIEELVPKFIFVDNDQIDPWIPTFDLGRSPAATPQYKGLTYSDFTDRVQTANITPSVELTSGQIDDLKQEDGTIVMPAGLQSIEIKLGTTYYINKINIKHANDDGRTINNVKVEIQNNLKDPQTGAYIWQTIYENLSAPAQYTIEFDKVMATGTYKGPMRISTIRISSEGSSLSTQNTFKQVEAFGDWKLSTSYSFASDTVWDSEGRLEGYIPMNGTAKVRFDDPSLPTNPQSPMTRPNQRVRYRTYYTNPDGVITDIKGIKVSNYYTGAVYTGLRSDLTPVEGIAYDYLYDYIDNTIWRTAGSTIQDGEEVVVVLHYIQENLSNLPLCSGYRDPATGLAVTGIPASVAETDAIGAWVQWEFKNDHRCDWYIGWIADIGLGDVDIYLDGKLTISISQHTALIERFSQIIQDLKPGNHTIKLLQRQGRVNFDIIKLEDYQVHHTSVSNIANPNLNPIELFEWYPVNHRTEVARKYIGRGSQVMSGAYETIRVDKETKIPNNQVPIKYRIRFTTQLLDRGEPIEDYGSFGGETGSFTFERGAVMFTSITMEEGVNPTYWRMAPSVDKYPGFMIESWDEKDPGHTGIQNAHLANGAITSEKLKSFSIVDKHIASNANIQESKILLNYATHPHDNKGVIDLITGLGDSGVSSAIARADHSHIEFSDLTITGALKEIGKYDIVHRKPLYGIAGDLQMQTSATAWEILTSYYSLFGSAVPVVKAGATRYYRLYAIYGDNILESDPVRARMRLKETGTGLSVYDWTMPPTWGQANGRRDAYSGFFTTASASDIAIEVRIQNDAGNYVGTDKEIGIEWLELIAYDVYEGGS